MSVINFIPYNTKIPFVKYRFISFGVCALIMVATFVSLSLQGLNFGIDFKGGLVVEIRTPQDANLAELRHKVSSVVVGEASVQEFGSPRDVLIRVEQQPGGDDGQVKAMDKIKQTLGSEVDYRRVEAVGPKVSADLLSNGLVAVVLSLLAMLAYVWFRYEWEFGLCGVLALVYDAITIVGLYTIFRLDFNEAGIIAILLTATYSINDTVVVFDRIRENMRKYKKIPFSEIINQSLNDTLSRTILTSSTTLMALVVLYLFGGPVISDFSLPIICGVTAGTFSSITVAAPLLLFFNLRPEKIIGEEAV